MGGGGGFILTGKRWFFVLFFFGFGFFVFLTQKQTYFCIFVCNLNVVPKQYRVIER